MTSRALVLVVTLALAFVTTVVVSDAEARTPKRAKQQKATASKSSRAKATKGRASRTSSASDTPHREHTRGRAKKPSRRVAFVYQGPAAGQSVGAPWAGRLQEPAQLPGAERYYIRRPYRAFGTRSTVELVQRALGEVLDAFPDVHVLAVGDLSAEKGGWITDHHSHQSGRDIDLGLFYTEKPQSYPGSFVEATDDNIDAAATFALLEAFAQTTSEDGGVQVMFLGFKVQAMLYNWALDHGVDQDRLDRMFQLPHGRGGAGLIRHEPNHDNHIHIRFKCPSDDTACR